MAISSLQAELNRVNNEIAAIKKQIQSYAEPDDENLRIQKYEAASQSIMEQDPDLAMRWQGQADKIKQYREQANLRLLNQQSLTKKERNRLEQLWKDLERSKRDALTKYGEGSVYYTKPAELQQRIESKLKEIAPDLWGGVEDTKDEVVQKDEVDKDLRLKQYQDASSVVEGLAVDDNDDGILDTSPAKIKKKIKEMARQYGWGADGSEVKTLLDYVDEVSQESLTQEKERFGRTEVRRKETRQRKEDIRKERIAQEDKHEWVYRPVKYLIDHPNDTSAKALALQTALRKKSGAAIKGDEFDSALNKLLPNDIYNDMLDEFTNMKFIAAKKMEVDDVLAKKIANKYMKFVSAGKIINLYGGPAVAGYYKWKELPKDDEGNIIYGKKSKKVNPKERRTIDSKSFWGR